MSHYEVSTILRNTNQVVHLLAAREGEESTKFAQIQPVQQAPDTNEELPLPAKLRSLQSLSQMKEPTANDFPELAKPARTVALENLVPPLMLQDNSKKFEIITLVKDGGLGFAVSEGVSLGDEESGIFIKNITEGGAAAKDGRLQIGDQLVAVDHKSLIDLPHAEAVNILKQTKGTVT